MMVTENRFIEERQQHILNLLKEYGRITVKELCREFKVSNVTIRNDLNELEKKGMLLRTHGGAISSYETGGEQPFFVRMHKHPDEKQRMAKAAADLIRDGEAIFIDGGTTASVMKLYLFDKKDLTIVTSSIEVVSHLASHDSIEIFMMGGFFKRESLSTLGASSANVIENWNITKAFYGAYGFSIEHGLTDVHPGLIEQKHYIANKAVTNIGLLDSSKWGKVSRDTFLPADKIDIIITDNDAPKDMIAAMKDRGIEYILV
jgi:DeoR/GlpR family transcriptional regulator of sugar metabolism